MEMHALLQEPQPARMRGSEARDFWVRLGVQFGLLPQQLTWLRSRLTSDRLPMHGDVVAALEDLRVDLTSEINRRYSAEAVACDQRAATLNDTERAADLDQVLRQRRAAALAQENIDKQLQLCPLDKEQATELIKWLKHDDNRQQMRTALDAFRGILAQRQTTGYRYAAFVGSTGQGKSTLINALTGFSLPTNPTGNTTRAVGSYQAHWQLDDGDIVSLHILDTPGLNDRNPDNDRVSRHQVAIKLADLGCLNLLVLVSSAAVPLRGSAAEQALDDYEKLVQPSPSATRQAFPPNRRERCGCAVFFTRDTQPEARECHRQQADALGVTRDKVLFGDLRPHQLFSRQASQPAKEEVLRQVFGQLDALARLARDQAPVVPSAAAVVDAAQRRHRKLMEDLRLSKFWARKVSHWLAPPANNARDDGLEELAWCEYQSGWFWRPLYCRVVLCQPHGGIAPAFVATCRMYCSGQIKSATTLKALFERFGENAEPDAKGGGFRAADIRSVLVGALEAAEQDGVQVIRLTVCDVPNLKTRTA